MSATQPNGRPARRSPPTSRPPRPPRRQQSTGHRAVLLVALVLAHSAAGVLVAAAQPGLYGAANAAPPLSVPTPPAAEVDPAMLFPAKAAPADFAPQSRPQVRRSPLLRRKDLREQLAEFQPLETCDAPIYCKPVAGANWYAGDEQVVVQWNKAQANLLTTASVDLALYERRKDNSSKLSDHTLIYQEKYVNVARGFKFINVDNATIFSKWTDPANVTGSTAVTRIHFWVITASFAPQTTNEEPGPDFFISSTARPTSNSTTASTVTTTSTVHTGTGAATTKDSAKEALTKPIGIALLTVGGFAVLCALTGLVYWWRRRTGSRDATSPRRDTSNSISSTVVDNVAPDGRGARKSEDGSARTEPATSAQPREAATEQDDGPITSSDARMLALAFHRLLRKPSWMDLSDASSSSTAPATVEVEERLKVEEEFRRRTRELVRRQLDEEGTGIKTVSVHSMGEAGGQSDGQTTPGGASDDEASEGEADRKPPGAKRVSGDGRASEQAIRVPVQPRSATMSGEISSPALESPAVPTLSRSHKSAG